MFIHKSAAVLEYGNDVLLVNTGDRIMMSGGCGHQVFTPPTPMQINDFLYILKKWDRDRIKEIAVLHREGYVNNKRAADNVDLLDSLSEEYRKDLKEKILSCDCSPSLMRKKLSHYFKLTKQEIDMLDLEDENEEFTQTIDKIIEISKAYIYD